MRVVLCLLSIYFLFSCSHGEEGVIKPVSKPLENDTIQLERFQFSNYGNTQDGGCGHLIVYVIRDTLYRYKPIEIPDGMQAIGPVSYDATIVIFPDTYECEDHLGDPVPGQPIPRLFPRLIEIINWKESQ